MVMFSSRCQGLFRSRGRRVGKSKPLARVLAVFEQVAGGEVVGYGASRGRASLQGAGLSGTADNDGEFIFCADGYSGVTGSPGPITVVLEFEEELRGGGRAVPCPVRSPITLEQGMIRASRHHR